MNPVPGDARETSAGTFVVGDLYLDVGQQRVTRAGLDVALPNLSFRLLVVLVHNAPNVISNESLTTQVWPGLVVSPETIAKACDLHTPRWRINDRDCAFLPIPKIRIG